jgi:hypothetical protein
VFALETFESFPYPKRDAVRQAIGECGYILVAGKSGRHRKVFIPLSDDPDTTGLRYSDRPPTFTGLLGDGD